MVPGGRGPRPPPPARVEGGGSRAPHRGAPITQPALFIGGTRDASTTWMADAIDAHATTLPALSASHLLDGCGHWVQQERPDEVNRLLTDWLATVHG